MQGGGADGDEGLRGRDALRPSEPHGCQPTAPSRTGNPDIGAAAVTTADTAAEDLQTKFKVLTYYS